MNGNLFEDIAVCPQRDAAPMHIDVIGVGASPYDFLNEARIQISGINVSEKSFAHDKSGRLKFMNQRSQYWWQMREALDPANNTGICLPDDKQLKLDLCAPMWELRGSTICVEGRESIIKRIGRSPDWASAYILALIDTPKMRDIRRNDSRNQVMGYDPMSHMDGFHNSKPREYDPLNFSR